MRVAAGAGAGARARAGPGAAAGLLLGRAAVRRRRPGRARRAGRARRVGRATRSRTRRRSTTTTSPWTSSPTTSGAALRPTAVGLVEAVALERDADRGEHLACTGRGWPSRGMGRLGERGLVEGLLDLDGLAGVDEPVHVGGHLRSVWGAALVLGWPRSTVVGTRDPRVLRLAARRPVHHVHGVRHPAWCPGPRWCAPSLLPGSLRAERPGAGGRRDLVRTVDPCVSARPSSPPPGSAPASSRPPRPAQGDAAAGRQAGHPVRGRGGGGGRHRRHPHRHRPLQEGHRGPLRPGARARGDAGSEGQGRGPGRAMRALGRAGRHPLRPPGRAARPRPRRRLGPRHVGDEPFAVLLPDDLMAEGSDAARPT